MVMRGKKTPNQPLFLSALISKQSFGWSWLIHLLESFMARPAKTWQLYLFRSVSIEKEIDLHFFL
jgi:hypothetical protein